MRITRKNFLKGGCIAGGVSLGPVVAGAAAKPRRDADNDHWFGYSLNMGTIRGQKLGLAGEVDVAIKAGYQGIEPWIDTARKYKESGGSLDDIRKRCEDSDLKVCGGIGFAHWIVNDDRQRAAGVEQIKRDMELLAQLGGSHIAAPPAGAHRPDSKIDLERASERYYEILEIGRDIGVIPQVEVWGFSANLSHISEAVYVAARSGHPDACVLSDVFHMYKGGSEAAAMKLLGRAAVHCFHLNDYPADPPRDSIDDSDRVWPGDGVAPIKEILSYLAHNRCRVFLSLELFNREYWKMDALECAKLGLKKMKAVAESY